MNYAQFVWVVKLGLQLSVLYMICICIVEHKNCGNIQDYQESLKKKLKRMSGYGHCIMWVKLK